MRLLALLFIGQFANFLIAVINIRACAMAKIKIAMGTDFVFCIVSYTLITEIAHQPGIYNALAYACGGMLGSLVAIKLTQHWDKAAA